MSENRMTPELCAVFVARFIEPSTDKIYMNNLVQTSHTACRWLKEPYATRCMREVLEKRFGNVFTMVGKNSMCFLKFNAAFRAARRWGLQHNESVMNWPGEITPQPQQPVLPAVGEPVVAPQNTISTEQVAKKLRAMSNTLAIFSQSLERLMEEREHNSMQLLDACRTFASDQRMLRQLIDSILPGGDNDAD